MFVSLFPFPEQALSPHLFPNPDFQVQDAKELWISQVRLDQGLEHLPLICGGSPECVSLQWRVFTEHSLEEDRQTSQLAFFHEIFPQWFILKMFKPTEKLKEQFNEHL